MAGSENALKNLSDEARLAKNARIRDTGKATRFTSPKRLRILTCTTYVGREVVRRKNKTDKDKTPG